MNLDAHRKTSRKEYPKISSEDIDRIFARVCRVPLMELFLNAEKEVSPAEEATATAFLQRRSESEPLQYIFGVAPFRDLELNIGKGVLIPRPETELIIGMALAGLPENALVGDVGTGSGAIALSLALERPDLSVYALDISEDALKYARKNSTKYEVKNIALLQSDLLEAVKDQKFDLIVANLPYVAAGIYETLDCEVRNFEPQTALVSGEDGLDDIRRLVAEAQDNLLHNGRIILEFSPEQEKNITKLLKDSGFSEVKVIKDLNNLARFAVGKKII